MPIRDDVSVDWTASPRIIGVAAPCGEEGHELTVQDLYDTLRDRASEAVAMDDSEIVEGGGKETLAPGTLVGLTVKLFNARVRFENRGTPTVCTVRGGNLVAVDEEGEVMSPIEASINVSVVVAQSTSASLIAGSGGADPEAIADAVWNEDLSVHQEEGTTGGALNLVDDVYLQVQSILGEVGGVVREALAIEILELVEIHRRLGLDAETPVVHSSSEIAFGDVVLEIKEEAGKVTVTRKQ